MDLHKFRFILFVICLIFISNNLLAETLFRVQERGYLKCGVSHGLPGFSTFNPDGTWSGIDIDICRAVSAAIFLDDKHVRFIPLSTEKRFAALQAGSVDLLARETTWTLSRDATLDLVFTNIFFYDGQGFMVKKSSSIRNIEELNNIVLCCDAGTTTELNAKDFFAANNLKYKIMTFNSSAQSLAAYEAGVCDVYSDDKTALATRRLKLLNPTEHIILSETISKEPLSAVVRHDDPQWENIVRWVIFGLMNAEEAAITKKNVDTMLKSNSPNIQRLLGVKDNLGHHLGLSADFLYYAIKIIGNYGEIFDRNLGTKSKLNLSRAQNKLWTDGGLIYGAPFR